MSDRVGVVGLGLLGRGIVACLLGHGYQVVAVDRDAGQRGAALEPIRSMIFELVELGGFDEILKQNWISRYTPTDNFALLKDCSFVFESVTEDASIKDAALDSIESAIDPAVVIASNTSAIPISRLQQRRKYPDRFVGMHWAEPAHATRFMELIRGDETSESAFHAAESMARRLGKDPSLCQKDVAAFIVNRIGYAMFREALNVLQSGIADADTIDRSMRNALGLWATMCGPLRWIDITGGPELYARAMKQVLPTLSKADILPPVMQDLADSGARGIINGRGFFNYSPEEARQWEDLYRKHAWRVTRMQNEYFPLNGETKT